jgi:iron complex outermembrane receptor protein
MQKLFFVLALLCFVVSNAQNTISGTIVDELNNPLSGSHVHIGKKTDTSDELGNYKVKNTPSGNVKVYISFVGYQSIDTIVLISSDKILNFKMKKKSELLKEVKVKSNTNNYNQTIAEQKVKTEAIERSSNQTLGDALKSVTGVSILKSGSTIVKPVINGLHSNRVPIINNNVRLEDQQWGSEHAPNFDINSAGKITVIKGASGLQFGGDAIGGLVLLEPISIKNDTLFGKSLVTLNSNGRGGTINTSIHKGNFCDFSWNLQGSFKYMGDRETPNYILTNSGNREANFSGDVKYIGKKYDLSAFYSFYNTTIGILSASHIGNVTDLYNAIQNQTPYVVNDFTYTILNPKQEVKHHLAKINYNKILNDDSVIGIQYAFQHNNRFEFDVRRGNRNDRAALDLTLITHSFNVDYKKEMHDWDLKTGLVASYQNNYANPETGVNPLIPTYDKFDAGVYGIVSHKLSDKFVIENGLRYDFSHIDVTKFYLKSRWDERNYNQDFTQFIVGDFGNQWLTNPKFTFNNVSASSGFNAKFKNDVTLYFNLSYAIRNPNPSEFFSDGLHHSTGMVELGDLRLKKEKSTKVSTAVQKKWSHFTININPYLNSISNFMFLRPIGFETTIRGAFPVWEYQQTNALLSGLDVETSLSLSSKLKHNFSLAYVNGKNKSNNDFLIDMPPLNIVNGLKFSKNEWQNLNLELKSEWVLRQNQFPNYNFITNIVENGNLKPVEVNVSSPPNEYHLVHFYSDVKFKSTKNSITTIAFSIQNLFNSNYRDYLNRQRFFVDELGRNFQLQLKINY